MKKVIEHFLKNRISIHISVNPKFTNELLEYLDEIKNIHIEVIKYDKSISTLEFNYLLCSKLLKEECFILITEDTDEYFGSIDIDTAVLDKLPTINFK
jgi:hypothetical protein